MKANEWHDPEYVIRTIDEWFNPIENDETYNELKWKLELSVDSHMSLQITAEFYTASGIQIALIELITTEINNPVNNVLNMDLARKIAFHGFDFIIQRIKYYYQENYQISLQARPPQYESITFALLEQFRQLP